MGGFAERATALMITLPSSLVIAIVILLTIYKMIDGEFPFIAGVCVIFVSMFLLSLCIFPPSPYAPGIILMGVIGLMVGFPFAERQLSDLEHREVESDALEKAIHALRMRADNVAAEFAVADALYKAGYHEHAVAVGRRASSRIAERHDDVGNRSLRDSFRKEEYLLKQWGTPPPNPMLRTCGACHHECDPGQIVCPKCGRDYVLDRFGRGTDRKILAGKLLLTWVVLGLTLAGAAASTAAPGILAPILLVGIIATAGGVLAIVFKPRR